MALTQGEIQKGQQEIAKRALPGTVTWVQYGGTIEHWGYTWTTTVNGQPQTFTTKRGLPLTQPVLDWHFRILQQAMDIAQNGGNVA